MMQLSKWHSTLLSVIFSLSILYIGFFVKRTDFFSLIFSFLSSFISFLCLSKILYKKSNLNFKSSHLIYGSIVLRFLLCFSFPHLSDDIFRFYWDGKLIALGYNPFSYLPSYFIDNQILSNPNDLYIFNHLNSPNYFSVYPPVCQAVFFIAYKMSFENVYWAAFWMKFFLLACEVGIIFLIKKLSSEKNALLYVLNPLCIIEICGNLHFEGAMIFFLLASFYMVQKSIVQDSFKDWLRFTIYGSILFAFSVCSKLLTLLFLPLMIWSIFVKSTNFKFFKLIILPFLSISFIAVFFLPFIDKHFVANFSQSLNLYFEKFEFNASFYYLLKYFQTWYYGFHPIQLSNKYLKIIVLGSLFYMTFFYKKSESSPMESIYKKCYALFFIYLLCQSTVHPWYLTTLVVLSILAKKQAGIIWSGLIFLTYSHYQGGFYQENYYFIGLEYFTLLAFLIIENYKREEIFILK